MLPAPPVDQHVAGQVVRPGVREMVPVPRIMVTLHRVGSDRAGPLDSVRADASGHYAFTYRRTGDESAIYFASASYGGIAYFTPPLSDTVVKGENAEIAVFDTTSVGIPIGVRGHHVVVSAVDANARRSVTEVYELANDSSVTRIARGPGVTGPVWTARVPAQATDFSVSQGDIPAAAVAFSRSRVSVFAPIAPGLAQLAFSYSLPASSFPLSVSIQQPTQIFEVLVEDEKGSVRGAKLKEKNPVVLERRSFRRFLADDVPVNAVSVIDLPAVARGSVDRRYLVVLTLIIGGAMIAALARALRRS
ncbi:MAG TPA: hypothetical protein VGJ64_00105 [Gemmatimonadaceae bacterium]